MVARSRPVAVNTTSELGAFVLGLEAATGVLHDRVEGRGEVEARNVFRVMCCVIPVRDAPMVITRTDSLARLILASRLTSGHFQFNPFSGPASVR